MLFWCLWRLAMLDLADCDFGVAAKPSDCKVAWLECSWARLARRDALAW